MSTMTVLDQWVALTDSSSFKTNAPVATHNSSGNRLVMKGLQHQSQIQALLQPTSSSDALMLSKPTILTAPILGSLIPIQLFRLPVPPLCVSRSHIQNTRYIMRRESNASHVCTSKSPSQQGAATVSKFNNSEHQKASHCAATKLCEAPNTLNSSLSSNTKENNLTNERKSDSTITNEPIKPSSSSCRNAKNVDSHEEKKDKNPVNEMFCFVCNVTCESEEFLQIHKEDKDFLCRVCVQKFSEHDELEAHFKTHKRYNCKKCKDVFFSKVDILKHRKINQQCNSVTECKICKKTFTDEYISTHMKNFHSIKSTDEMLKCSICGKLFKSSKNLETHLKVSHHAYELLECQICKKFVSGPDKLKYHKKQVHVKYVKNNPMFSCHLCQKMFTKSLVLKNHMKIHEDKEALCELCGKNIKERNMKWHILREHSENGTYPCKKCNETFDTYYNMMLHYNKHNRKNYYGDPVFCEICGKKYRNSQVLKRHYAIHSDLRPFKCETCDASFKQDVALRHHRRTHSSIGKYFCNGCDKSFRWKQTFTNHLTKCKQSQEIDDELD